MPTKVVTYAFFLTITMFVVAPPKTTLAITCGDVVKDMMPCLGYLRNGGPVPSNCCKAAQSLNNMARTTPNRQTTCACLKQGAKTFAVNYNNAAQLAPKCGIDLDVPISPNTDCSKVH